MKLENKVVVVTGAGNGMGRELVLQLLRRRASVAALDINDQTLRETASLAAERAASLATFTANITDRAAVEALPRAVMDRFGDVDGLINCAGIIQPFVRLTELDYAPIDRVFDVNWRGALYPTKTFLPALLERPEAHIVNISSMGGFLPVPGQTAYGASKAASSCSPKGCARSSRIPRCASAWCFRGRSPPTSWRTPASRSAPPPTRWRARSCRPPRRRTRS